MSLEFFAHLKSQKKFGQKKNIVWQNHFHQIHEK